MNEPIAIIGSGCRFPGGCNNPSKLWDLLREPRDLSTLIPPTRFNPDAFFHPDNARHGTSNVRHAYLLSEDHRRFDTQFFSIKPVEANSIDPQQRLLMETVYESIEAAGLRIEELQGTQTAVYVGLMCGDFADLLTKDPDSFPTYISTGTARSIMSNRISYFFDWHGPSMTIDTACSSSLVALDHAVQILRSGQSRMAIAAGSNLILAPEPFIAESKLKMLSPSGRSRMWDHEADGYARGDGVAAIVLKTLTAAIEDGDHIECLVRETGVNQDGRTKGITMPSATAQAALIRSTYARAGLDLRNSTDRPQYFEAHGTGTPAGDPIEAEAISNAFFPRDIDGLPDQIIETTQPPDVLYVGSIKTVVGHTEGTAGLAAVLKASLALQNRVIPPNLLFNKLNPNIEPFYAHLEVPTKPQEWPGVSPGMPRRASVNSFGFGGTNAHAILESYEPPAAPARKSRESNALFAPLTFSTTTEQALAATLHAYSAYLKTNSTINLRDLAWTLQSRRSNYSVRAAFSGTTVAGICAKIDQRLEEMRTGRDQSLGIDSSQSHPPSKARILGVFTGQGAQWAGMGKELILGSDTVRHTIRSLEARLARLPKADRPSWSLEAELLAGESTSRVKEAAISQPLCTAVQIVLVDLLASAGVVLDAVVGHSSGEIGCSYASGLLTADDAICIAYYRGLHSTMAQGPEGQRGAMMAVGTSPEDAQELCQEPEFKNRLYVAAVNSGASITLSGDEDCIAQAKNIFDDEQKFARLLAVDKAYHSHHMLASSTVYAESLKACNIEMQTPKSSNPTWFSSVSDLEMTPADVRLKDDYWVENMVKPVLFAQAVECATAAKGPFNVALEIGPHPALKGPVTQVIGDLIEQNIPYSGVLMRGQDDVESFASGLGFLWTQLGPSAVNFKSLGAITWNRSKPRLLKGLPSYSWNHDRIFWHESRVSRMTRTRHVPVHELLGSRVPDGLDREFRWRNLLSPSEIPYLSGHQIQGQIVFPAAGYVATAVEAAIAMSPDDSIQLVELQDLEINQALLFEAVDSRVEILISITDVVHYNGNELQATYSYFSALGKEPSAMTLNAKGRLRIVYGPPTADILPSRARAEKEMIDVSEERFYSTLTDLGYGYTGPFRALTQLKRKLGRVTGVVESPAADKARPAGPSLHPAMLDAAIQSVMLAKSWPGDGRLFSLHVPTTIDRIAVNPALLAASLATNADRRFPFDTVLDNSVGFGICGDVSIYDQDGATALVQMEGMRASPLDGADPARDRKLFSAVEWDVAVPDGAAVAFDGRATHDDFELAYILERVAHFYLRSFDRVIPRDHPARSAGPYVGLLRYARHVSVSVSSGTHTYGKKEWEDDGYDLIQRESQRFPDNIDLKIMHIIGEHMPAVMRSEANILEHLRMDNILDDYYSQALGISYYTEYLARLVSQVVHRYPHVNILEIGAGTGGATKQIIKKINDTFSSYTFTDISNGFFENAQNTFRRFEGKMKYKVLDIEKDITAQEFTDRSYDLIIASFVLHATRSLEQTLKNVRRLLKPGGFLLVLEVTNLEQCRLGYIFGSLPGWWLGEEDGRPLSPCVTKVEWDALLRRTGFSGIDTVTPDLDPLPFPASAFVSQAIDPSVEFIRDPLSHSAELIRPGRDVQQLVILGGYTTAVRRLRDILVTLLQPRCDHLSYITRIEDLSTVTLSPMTSILNLGDLDEPLFRSMTAPALAGLKNLFTNSKNIFWVTQGSRADDPHMNQSLGFGRSMLVEMPHIRSQFLDLSRLDDSTPRAIAQALLRFVVLDSSELSAIVDSTLWTTETEFAIDDGKDIIPRIKLKTVQNDRYNATRRNNITKEVDVNDTVITVLDSGTSYSLESEHDQANASALINTGQLLIDVDSAILKSVQLNCFTCLFLVLGTIKLTGKKVLALSECNANHIVVDQSRVVSAPPAFDKLALRASFTYLLCLSLVEDLSENQTIVAIMPDEFSATVLADVAKINRFHVVFVNGRCNSGKSQTIHMHENASIQEIRRSLPRDASLFLNFGGTVAFVSRIAACASPMCKIRNVASFLHAKSHMQSSLLPFKIRNMLELASSYARILPSNLKNVQLDLVGLNEIPSVIHKSGDILAIDWKSSSRATVQVQPVDLKPMLSSEKTYWLVGLTGSLGISLCRWMIRQGARYIVLTSRHPNIHEDVLIDLEAMGATVKIIAGDVNDRSSLRAVYDEIRSTLPLVGGVAQGAMTLRDMMIANMDIAAMNDVLRPKVEGSINLDGLFSTDTLDFFIFFSSATCVTGNLGQSNYAAANMFMTALAAQRRKRGLAGSAIAIGAILGVGYVTRETSQSLQNNLLKSGHIWMSEEDFHVIFAEAILCGAPGSTQSSEVITGLRLINAADEQRPLWSFNPRFQHLVFEEHATHDADYELNGGIPVRTQLLGATSREQAFAILKESFVQRLKVMLQLDDQASLDSIIGLVATDDLGIDSLNSVEIRSWFLKEVKVDMPVLRILGGATIEDLVKYAVERLPQDAVPRIEIKDTRALQTSNENDVQGPKVAHTAPSSEDDSYSLVSTPGMSDTQEPGPATISSVSVQSDLDLITTKPLLQRTEAMSFGQSRFWFLRSYLEDKTTFNITCSISLKGALRIDDFANAVRVVGQRHEALRTCFFANDQQQPMQGVLAAPQFCLERKTFHQEEEVHDEVAAFNKHVYDLERGQTMRILLLTQVKPYTSMTRQPQQRHQILIGYHHINMDGISLEIILAELEKAYNHEFLTSTVLQYPDFASRQRQEYSTAAWADDLVFWRKVYSDMPPTFPILGLSEIKSRRTLTAYKHHRVDMRIKSSLAEKIRAACQTYKVTPYHFHLAVFQVLLTRLSGVPELCIGVASANRTESDMADSVGFYLNLLPLRFKSDPKQTFVEALKEARTKANSAMSHSRIPFNVLLEELKVPRSATYNPLFQVFLDYRRGVEEKRTFGNCQLEGQDYEIGRTSYDIALDVVDNMKGESLLLLAVQADLYPRSAATLLTKSYMNLLEAFSANCTLRLTEPTLHAADDVNNAISLGLGAVATLSWPLTLTHRVDAMAERYPSNVALKDGLGNMLTYAKMAARVDTIAESLYQAKLRVGSRIGVFQEPSTDWICSMLAILRLGAVYVPLDLRVGISRITLIVQDCKLDGLVIDSTTAKVLPELGIDVKAIDISTIPVSSTQNPPPNIATPGSAATILYTSGSTGTPKGIVLSHESLRNNIEGNTQEFQIQPNDIMLQQIALSFDFSIWQIFMAIANGATLYVVPQTSRLDARALAGIIMQEHVTVTGATPTEYVSWLRYSDSKQLRSSAWNKAISAGEHMTNAMKRDFMRLGKTDLRLWNGYGPTEAALSCAKVEISYADVAYDEIPERPTPAGFVAPNYQLLICDDQLNPLPVGVLGQILIGGAGVAMEYLNNGLMTAERFVSNRFAPAKFVAAGWNRFHLTGDRGRLRSDGALVIDGRIAGDTQIKLRGLRIDLRDIEATLIHTANGALHEAIVSLRRAGPSSPEFMVAHVLFSPEYPAADAPRFLQQIAGRLPLPHYMRPAMIIPVAEMPTSVHLKLDRKAIAALELPRLSQESLESLTVELSETEYQLMKIWERLLSNELPNVGAISKTTDFFHMGGNSLLLLALRAEILKVFGVDLPLVPLFENSTLEAMATHIQSRATSNIANVIDWDLETELPGDLLQNSPSTKATTPRSSSRVIVLTGATGFLGTALLEQLEKDEHVSKIHCIAVRSSPKRQPLTTAGKVIVHMGDLEQPRLGLSHEASVAIFREADAVIHNGADVSFLKSYATLKPANVGSTLELLRMSLAGHATMHYISTTGVGSLNDPHSPSPCDGVLEETSVGSLSPPTNSTEGYIASKWASEQLLERAATRLRSKIYIHRPSSITGPSAPELDVMHNLIHYSRMLKAVPQSPFWQGHLDFVSVGRVARGVLRDVLGNRMEVGSGEAGAGQTLFRHHSGEVQVELKDMKNFVEKMSGEVFRSLGLADWVQEAETAGMSGLLAAYLRRVDTETDRVFFPRVARVEQGERA